MFSRDAMAKSAHYLSDWFYSAETTILYSSVIAASFAIQLYERLNIPKALRLRVTTKQSRVLAILSARPFNCTINSLLGFTETYVLRRYPLSATLADEGVRRF